MTAVFVDASPALAAAFERLHRAGRDPALRINRNPDVRPDALPGVLDGAAVMVVDHTAFPAHIARQCRGLTDVVFLGTGARSYMDPEALAELGIAVHLIRGYGDTAVAEMAFALMWAAAKGIAPMDNAMRAGRWLRTDGVQLTGKTAGLLGFGGIAAEFARLARGAGMEVVAWNRTAKTHPGVRFLPLDDVLAAADVLSIHLLLMDETRGFLSAERLAQLKPGAILVNTARGAIVDEPAMVDALRRGRLHAAGLDVFDEEPLPPNHVLTTLPNVVLSAHSAFRTPEASDALVSAALAHCRRIAE